MVDTDPSIKDERINVHLYPDEYQCLRRVLARQRLIDECKQRRKELIAKAQGALVSWAVVAAATAFVTACALYAKPILIAIVDAVRNADPGQ